MDAGIRRYAEPRDFFAAVRPLCEPREVENSLFLGVAKRLAERGDRGFFIALESGAGTVAAALRAPPHEFSICMAERPLIERLADAVVATGEAIPAVIGVEQHAAWFGDRLAARLRRNQRTRLRMAFYVLDQVVPPPVPAPGALRPATPSDRAWLTDWMVSFASEDRLPAFERDRAYASAQVDRTIAEGRRFVWEDKGRPVAVAGYNDTGINAARIGGVRTAPDERGKGYASVMVASLSRHLIAAGKSWCGLFADVGNPQSNRIYQRIGYREACRFHSIQFE